MLDMTYFVDYRLYNRDNQGWAYKTELEDGIRLSYKDFLENPMRAER